MDIDLVLIMKGLAQSIKFTFRSVKNAALVASFPGSTQLGGAWEQNLIIGCKVHLGCS